MRVELNDQDLNHFIRNKIADGFYRSSSEIVREALYHFKAFDHFRQNYFQQTQDQSVENKEDETQPDAEPVEKIRF